MTSKFHDILSKMVGFDVKHFVTFAYLSEKIGFGS